MKRTERIQLLGAAMAFAALGLLFVRSQTPHLEAHTRIAAELPRVKELDAALNFNLIQSRVGLLMNYDPIVVTQARLRTSDQCLAQAIVAAYPNTPDDIARPLREYGELLTQKEDLIESFKSSNAILRNSVQYLPVIARITEIETQGGVQHHSEQIDILLRAALIYINRPVEENRAQVIGAIQSLEKWLPLYSSEAKQDARLLIAHTRMILTQKERVDALVGQLMNLPTRERSEKFTAAYQSHYAVTVRQANGYRLGLFGACLLLVVFVGGILTKLKRSQACLQSEQENLEQRIAERTQELLDQAFHDTLTGLPNRAQVLYHLKEVSDQKKPGGKAVLFLDLDNFKFINDSLGHKAGDELLIAVTQRLKNCVRPADMVARLGGDEFLIVMEDVASVEASVQIAERALQIMRPGFSLSGGEGFTSASIGIAYTEADAIDPDILIRDADTAMYHAKSSGKSAYALFETGMNDRLTERVAMEVGMRLALNRKEFRVHYQPLIDLNTGHLSGVEALVRWQHPQQGLIAPGKFIPIAEETGLIIPLGYWTLEEACRQALVWKQTYPDHGLFTTNVNLSGKQLQKPDVVERVRAILEKTGLSAEYLKIEITESVMMEDVELAIAKLTQLKSLGVKLALDDFGTGYSSMASLSSFPLDTVKIDRAFIAKLNTGSDADSVVAAIIMLAKSLNIDVTGEGIETPEQLMSLQGLGCDIGQGYFFDEPLDAEALEERMMKKDNAFVKNYTQTDMALIERLLAETDGTKLEDLPEAA